MRIAECGIVVAMLHTVAFAQPLGDAARWPMERVTLHSGESYEGLIEHFGSASVQFIEIHRPRGRPMHLVIRSIERNSIASVRQLSDRDREALSERIRSFRNRAVIEAGRMDAIPLERASDGSWHYRGQWFELTSTAEEATMRLTIVRLEQVFLAYRHVLPPRETPKRDDPIRFLFLGTTDEYYRHLRQEGLLLINPSYFDVAKNMVVTSSDVGRVNEQLAAARKQHADLIREYERQNADFPNRLRKLHEDLKQAGVPIERRREIAAAARQKWQSQVAAMQRDIAAAERKNLSLLDEVIAQTMRRLYHEAFHAYLENDVYDSKGHDVPRWLNEGLAQIFESGRLEVDSLRIDAPDPRPLVRLQEDLAGAEPLSIERILDAEQEKFLVPHRADRSTSKRYYLYSWGLAYYLTFHESLLGTEALDRYVAAESKNLPPKARFEQLTGKRLEEFEKEWRKYILELRPGR